MTDRPAAFTATYSDFRLIKGRKVAQFVYEVPLEQCSAALAVMGGMPNPAAEVWCAIARLTEPTESEVMQRPASEPGPAPARAKSLAQIAGMACTLPMFQKFVNASDEELAARYVRAYCGVQSRTEIKIGTEAGERFERLYRNFFTWRDADRYVEAS